MTRVEGLEAGTLLLILSGLAEAVGTTPYGFLAALAGVMAAVCILPVQPVERPASPHRSWAARTTILAAGFASWALVAAWAAGVLTSVWGALQGAPELPVHGLCGIAIRPLLPRLLRVAERRTDKLGD